LQFRGFSKEDHLKMAKNPVILIKPKRFSDDRGWFSETFNETKMARLGIDARFLQDNHSYSKSVGTLRGLHFQRPPHAQAKLVRCLRGEIFDVAVDLRRGSPTYGSWEGMKLSAESGDQLYIPIGFAHGFVTLTPDAEIAYKVSDYYAPECDAGIRWDDRQIAISWPLPASGPVLSAKDARLPSFSEFESPFSYDGAPLVPLLAVA
jgi:dTDP-4-dehydrorhamnose 3,5-epimerase